jgi:hypothetical protein
MRVYPEIVMSMLSGMTPEQILAFKPSLEVQQRASELAYSLNYGTLTADERAELEHFREIDSIIRLAKVKAHKHVKNG